MEYIRANYFIPDARKFWVRSSVAKIKKYLAENTIDVILTTGPPHSVHLIGLALKKSLQIKWLADFRDPWTSLYYNDEFNFSSYAKKKNLALEQEVLKQADKVLTVSNSLREELQCPNDKIAVVTNGFDGEVQGKPLRKNGKFTISYIGFLPKQSNPTILWEVLEELVKTNEDFKKDLEIRLTGSISREANVSIAQHGIDAYTNITGYVPHEEAIHEQLSASILLLLVPKTTKAKGIVTGKVFEYLQAKRPILAIGPEDGDLAAILNETSAGVISGFENKTSLKNNILNFYRSFQNNTLLCNSKGIEKYHRRALTKELVEILKVL
ncbi:glycosyltransferase [Tenacibaculum sp. SG-28]|uniref:glycosyltransferase n=1 Tax=Tenacibaculum sp. SG-28 TaxID=754426 RepID=UPI001E5ACD2D|nr:glycosyltransferase [Tenacibaculum sp. SG-28]